MKFVELGQKYQDPKIQVLVILLTLVLAISTSLLSRDSSFSFLAPFSIIFAILVVIELIYAVVLEMKGGIKKNGIKEEIKDTLIALVVAVGFWYLLGIVLNTSAPISAVVSCSMLPNLERGDFVIVQGSEINAPQIQMTQHEFEEFSKDPVVFYNQNQSAQVKGSAFTNCLINPNSEACLAIKEDPAKIVEKRGEMEIRYSACPLKTPQGSVAIPCQDEFIYKGKTYLSNFSNDIVVYAPSKNDAFSKVGDIVHRAIFKIKVENQTYLITKGDNNPVMDIGFFDSTYQLGNSPVPKENLRGKVFFRIPYLGYLKLFLSGQVVEDGQCKTQLSFEKIK